MTSRSIEASAEESSFGYSVTSVTFSDDSVVGLPESGVVAIVGPNNAGKSQALRDIAGRIGAHSDSRPYLAVTAISDSKRGTAATFFAWLRARARIKEDSISGVGFSFGTGDLRNFTRSCWESTTPGLDQLGKAVGVFLDTETRLTAANPCKSYDAVGGHPSLPLQALYEDRDLETRLSKAFSRAYKQDLIVNRLGGNRIHLHVGVAPDAVRFGGTLSVEYHKELRDLPLLHEQGDGMRSFAACLLFSDVVSYPVVFIDEPETFLHPSSARVLSHHLAASTATSRRQVFLSTHSGDVVRGLLDAGRHPITIIRLERDGSKNRAKTVDADSVRKIWADPLLRVSNILDGLFHEHVCLCEADTDVRFYGAMLAADCAARKLSTPDVLFCHCNGKHRMPSVVRALRSIGVPVTVVADIDLIADENPLRSLWEASGHSWSDIAGEWKSVSKAVDQTRGAPLSSTVRDQVMKILDGLSGKLDEQSAAQIREATKSQGGWQPVKRGGEAALPKGQARSAYDTLKAKLRERGIALVPVGELEGFLPTVGSKGPAWVNKAIEYDLAHAPELAAAREFVRGLPFMNESRDDSADAETHGRG